MGDEPIYVEWRGRRIRSDWIHDPELWFIIPAVFPCGSPPPNPAPAQLGPQ